MEFLTDSLRDVVSKLSEGQKEEIDIIESIINTNEANKEKTKEKLFRFLEKRKPEYCINFILGCINHAAKARPKEEDSFHFILTSIYNNFHLNHDKINNFDILKYELSNPNVRPSSLLNYSIFDYGVERSIRKVIYEDNIELFQKLYAVDFNDQIKNELFFLRFSPFRQ